MLLALMVGCVHGGDETESCSVEGLASANVVLIHAEAGGTGTITTPTQIYSEAEYQTVWAGFAFPGEPPPVDFGTRTVVAYSIQESDCKDHTILHGFFVASDGNTLMRNENVKLCATCDTDPPLMNRLWEAPAADLSVCEFETKDTGC